MNSLGSPSPHIELAPLGQLPADMLYLVLSRARTLFFVLDFGRGAADMRIETGLGRSR